LTISSPAGTKHQIEIGEKGEVVLSNEGTTEDPIINEVPSDTKDRMELNPRSKPIKKISISNVTAAGKPNVDLMGHNETELQSKVPAESNGSFHTHSNVSIVNPSETENQNVGNDTKDKFLLKHNHLGQLLSLSSFLGPLSQPNKNPIENQDEISSEIGVDEFSRMITAPDITVETREDKNDGFQDRSDVNLTTGNSENDGENQ